MPQPIMGTMILPAIMYTYFVSTINMTHAWPAAAPMPAPLIPTFVYAYFLSKINITHALPASAYAIAAMPIIKLTMADIENGTPDTHLTIFENLGEMVPDAAFIHVLAPVNLTIYRNMFSKARALLRAITHEITTSKEWKDSVWYQPEKEKHLDLTILPQQSDSIKAGVSIGHQLQGMQSHFTDLINLLPSQPEQGKHKREVITLIIGALAALVGGIVGTYLGTYSQAQVETLKITKDLDLLLHIDDQHHEIVANLEKRVNLAFQAISNMQKAELDNQHMIWSGILTALRYRTTQLTDFVTELQKQRLSMTWFSSKQMKALHQQVLQQAKDNNLTPLVSHLSDYYQLDVTYVKSENFITAIIHVPATASNHVFTVYRYIPFPIPTGPDQIVSVFAPDNIIAVGPDHHHKVLTKDQFDNCVNRNKHFICEAPLVTNTNFSTTCVGSLMDHNHEGVKAHCSLKHAQAQEMVFQLAAQKFVIFSPSTFTGRGKCLNGSHISRLISKVTTVEVPSGCELKLRNHIIRTPAHVIISTEPWVQETKWDTLEVPKALFAKRIREEHHLQQTLLNDSRIQATLSRQLDSSLHALHQAREQIDKHLNEATNGPMYLYISIGAAAGIISLLCLCACVRYLACCQQGPQIIPPQYQLH